MRLNFVPADLCVEADAPPSHSQPGSSLRPQSAELALDRLYQSQAPRLLRFFIRRVGRDEALDLVHDCFVGLAGAAQAQTRTIEQPEAYLSGIANNVIARRIRTASRRSVPLHLPADDVPLSTGDPHAQLEARDALDRLEQAMLHLRPITRQVFIARRIDGYSYREIADRTGLSVKRVEKHMSRAIAELDHALSQK